MNDALHTAAALAAAASTALVAPLVVALSFFDERGPDPVIRLWCNNLLRASGMHREVLGLERLPAGHAVYVCNHQSNLDPVLVYASLGKHMRFLAKRELFKIPIFGSALRATGMVPVDRTGTERDKAAVASVVEAVRSRVSICFFPEGTRDPEGRLRAFKKGAVVLAIQAQVPLVPLALAGTKDVLHKRSLRVHGGRPVVLVVGEPIPTTGLSLEQRDALNDRARTAVAELLASANARVEEMRTHG